MDNITDLIMNIKENRRTAGIEEFQGSVLNGAKTAYMTGKSTMRMRIRLKSGAACTEIEAMFPGLTFKYGGRSRLVVYVQMGTGKFSSIGSLLKTGEFQFTRLGEIIYNLYNLVT